MRAGVNWSGGIKMELDDFSIIDGEMIFEAFIRISEW